MKWIHPNHALPDRAWCPYYGPDYSVPVLVTLEHCGRRFVSNVLWACTAAGGWVAANLGEGPDPEDYAGYGTVVAWALPPEACGPNDYAEVTDV